MHDLLHRMLICCRTRPPCTTPQLARAHPFAPSWCLSRCSAARFLRATHTVTVGRQMHEELLCVSLSFAKPLCIWFRGEEKPAHTYRRSSLFIPQVPHRPRAEPPAQDGWASRLDFGLLSVFGHVLALPWGLAHSKLLEKLLLALSVFSMRAATTIFRMHDLLHRVLNARRGARPALFAPHAHARHLTPLARARTFASS